MPNDDVDFVVRIRDIDNSTPASAKIGVRPNVDKVGDMLIGGTSDPNGTDVKFVLNSTMRQTYKFNNNPICVYDENAGATTCDPKPASNPFPAGWSIACKDPSAPICDPDKGNHKVVLHIPVLNQGSKYKYKLFLTDTSSLPYKTVVIDPKIGCCEIYLTKFEQFQQKLNLSSDPAFYVLIAAAVAMGLAALPVMRFVAAKVMAWVNG